MGLYGTLTATSSEEDLMTVSVTAECLAAEEQLRTCLGDYSEPPGSFASTSVAYARTPSLDRFFRSFAGSLSLPPSTQRAEEDPETSHPATSSRTRFGESFES